MDNIEVREIIDFLNRVHADLRAHSPNTILRVHQTRLHVIISLIEDATLASRNQELKTVLMIMEDRALKYLGEIDSRLRRKG